MAALAGVSPATVGRVLHMPEKVGGDMREKVSGATAPPRAVPGQNSSGGQSQLYGPP